MRILLISRCPPTPLYLGDRLIIYHLARELTERGFIIDLLAFANRPEDWETDWAKVPYFNSIQVFEEPRRSTGSYLHRWLLPKKRFPKRADEAWSPDMWRAIVAQLAQHPYDLVQLFGGVQVYEFLYAVNNLPHLIVPYESYSLYLERLVSVSGGLFAVTSRLRLWLAQQVERFMFTPYPAVVVVSEPDRQMLRQLCPPLPVVVIPNGIDLKQYAFDAQVGRAPHTLLFIGNYEYSPNVDAALYLIDVVLPHVQQQFPDVMLQIVGHAPPAELLQRRTRSVEITGRVPDVRPYLASATIFVCPLRIGAGIKNKVLEALAMGCPVITTQIGADGIAIAHEQHALIASSDQFGASVVRLLGDPQLQDHLSQHGKALIEEEYSWGHVAGRYVKLYAELFADG